MASLLLPAVTSATHAETRTIAVDRMIQIGFSLAMYKIDNGEYPDSLDKLIPGYLDELPIDPFCEQPFPYQKTKEAYSLYTVGPNMKDDGGNGYEADGDDYKLTAETESWEEFQSRQLNEIEITGGTFMTEEGKIWTNREQEGEEDESNEHKAGDLEDSGETSPVETESDANN